MNLITLILIIIIIFGLLGIGYILIYNKMQYLKTKIEQAEGLIDETLRERYDYLVRANDIVKNELTSNKDYFKDYINLKEKKITNFDMDRKLKEAFNLLNKLKDDYEELEKNKDLKEILKEINSSNEKITAGCSFYNRNTSELNELIRKFPSNIIARIHGFKISTFFDGKDMTDEIYNDFKL